MKEDNIINRISAFKIKNIGKFAVSNYEIELWKQAQKEERERLLLFCNRTINQGETKAEDNRKDLKMFGRLLKELLKKDD